MTKIHPSAVIDPTAVLGPNCEVGPFCVIEAGASVGAGCVIGARTSIKAGVKIGEDNIFSEGVVIGGRAQHLQDQGGGRVIIGRGNRFRENVTVHRAFHADSETRIGDHNLVMVNCHIAHDCTVGNNVVLVNNVMLAGHVDVADRAYLGGGAAVHQHCRVGRFAMVGGYARATRDIPPYVLIDGEGTEVVGLNKVGLKRNGFTSEQILDLKKAYRLIYREGLRWSEVLSRLAAEFKTGPAADYTQFFSGGKRGFVSERRISRKATLKLVKFQDAEEDQRDAREAA